MPRPMVLTLGVADLETSLLQREVAAFVAALPYQERAALLLRICHKLGYAEIAAALGYDEREVRATVHQVVRSLHAHLGDRLCANRPRWQHCASDAHKSEH